MAPVVDMSDKHAWDDSLLISSWEDALNEYKGRAEVPQYPPVWQKTGRCIDQGRAERIARVSAARVLPTKPSEAKSSNASRDYGDLMEETEAMSTAAETNGVADRDDASMSNADVVCVTQPQDNSLVQQEPDRSEQQNIDHAQSPSAEAVTAPVGAEPLADAMPQAILGTVKDENLKNIMMSWYYAGYYTGLHAGQQQQAAPKSSAEQ
ncbi:hypothetical protein yc1106_03744 [Curvularia clavata]|uniref:Survival motor neuron Tudor domain-containing protein n=1 Tax=Curvularia clavata TaxID=95742 RepID=A0A9Q8Z6B1_CURCL|nr:hypothetical protein yc1106_03744 [Curvularia clavata]